MNNMYFCNYLIAINTPNCFVVVTLVYKMVIKRNKIFAPQYTRLKYSKTYKDNFEVKDKQFPVLEGSSVKIASCK